MQDNYQKRQFIHPGYQYFPSYPLNNAETNTSPFAIENNDFYFFGCFLKKDSLLTDMVLGARGCRVKGKNSSMEKIRLPDDGVEKTFWDIHKMLYNPESDVNQGFLCLEGI